MKAKEVKMKHSLPPQDTNNYSQSQFKKVYTLKAFPENLKKVRLYRGFKTQGAFCDVLKVSRQLFSMWSLGKRDIRIMYLIDIANLLEIDLGYFFTEKAEPKDFDLTRPHKAR